MKCRKLMFSVLGKSKSLLAPFRVSPAEEDQALRPPWLVPPLVLFSLLQTRAQRYDIYLLESPISKIADKTQLQKADEILAQLGTGADAVKAAQGLVAAEQNFNPFVVHIPAICSDPSLPANALLRGIVPLIDPALGDSSLENSNSAASLLKAFNAAGMSVAQVMAAQGFSNFTTKNLAGNVGTSSGSGAAAGTVVTSNPAVAETAAGKSITK